MKKETEREMWRWVRMRDGDKERSGERHGGEENGKRLLFYVAIYDLVVVFFSG